MSFTIDADLRSFLLADPDIKSEVDTRIFPGGLLPQQKGVVTNNLPSITLLDVSAQSHITNTAGLTCYRQVRYQIEVWAEQLLDAKCVSDYIRSRIDGYRGVMGDSVIGGVFGRLQQAPRFEPGVKLWRVISDYMVHVLA